MSAIFTWFLQNFLLPILLTVLNAEESKIIAWIKGQLADSEQKKQDQTNVAAVQAAAQSGDKDALVNAETNLLNGTKPPSSD